MLVILNENGITFTSDFEKKESLREIKEKLCYVSCDYKGELIKAETGFSGSEYKLQDGKKIKIVSERYKAPEVLFNPSLIGSKSENLPNTIVNSIKECDFDLQRDLYPSIVLSGGTSMFEGLKERIKDEVTKLSSNNETIKIVATPNRKFGVWRGGSILSSLSTFKEMWITKDEYDETGVAIISRKCF